MSVFAAAAAAAAEWARLLSVSSLTVSPPCRLWILLSAVVFTAVALMVSGVGKSGRRLGGALPCWVLLHHTTRRGGVPEVRRHGASILIRLSVRGDGERLCFSISVGWGWVEKGLLRECC